MPDKTYISKGDLIDLFFKIKQKGTTQILSKFRFSNRARTKSKWNTVSGSSDFWIIPRLREHWNEKCTGNPKVEYADYLVSKYLSHSKDLKMLSVGCGSGGRERKFGKYQNFASIEGIDMAENKINEARESASKLGMNNINYHVGDFLDFQFESESYDVILFNSSLHHFNQINTFLKTKVKPLLKKDGLLVIHEYVGPNRLQWTKYQLERANHLLNQIPKKYKTRANSRALKTKNYRPGLFRMLLIDPSEAIDSESIIPSIHQHFETLEEKKMGWDILQVLLKDISHNFLGTDTETEKILAFLMEAEDRYMTETGRSDAVFGIYQKTN
jgi:ubiquinone/menaquinone biosynthesis C-methylase UbiE